MSFALVLSLLWGLTLLATFTIMTVRRGWIATLLVQFTPYYAIIFFVSAIYLAAAELYGFCVVALLFFLYHAGALLQCVRWRFSQPKGGGKTLKIFFANVNVVNEKVERIVEAIDSASPDLFLLIETSPELNQLLEDYLGTRWPYRSYHIYRGEKLGMQLCSRFPLEQIIVRNDREDPESASLLATVVHPSGRIRLVAAHPLSPERPSWIQRREEYLLSTAREARELVAQKKRVIVLGDLNATPWDPLFGDLLKVSGLRDARRGFGYVGTWPTLFPPMMIPLDHLLTSDGIEVTKFRRGKRIGSDHWPLEVTLSLMKS